MALTPETVPNNDDCKEFPTLSCGQRSSTERTADCDNTSKAPGDPQAASKVIAIAQCCAEYDQTSVKTLVTKSTTMQDAGEICSDITPYIPSTPLAGMRLWINQHWFYEVAACTLNILTLLAIFVLFRAYDGKPTPDWPRVITINSAAAVLTTATKGSMIYAVSEGLSQIKWSWFVQDRQLNDISAFDSASRGPWGALVLLLKFRLNILAVLGASIIVLSLGLDTFIQQGVSFEPYSVNDMSVSASVQRAQLFDYWRREYTIMQPTTQSLNEIEDLFRRSLSVNLINHDEDVLPPIEHQCATGNCTFQGDQGFYTTFTIASRCRDISSDITRVTTPAMHNYTLPAADNATWLSVQFPRGAYMATRATKSTLGDDVFHGFQTLMIQSTDSNKTLLNAYIGPAQAVAFQCDFVPHLAVMNAISTLGRLEEHIVSARPLSAVRSIRYVPDGISERLAENWTRKDYFIAQNETLVNGSALTCEWSITSTENNTLAFLNDSNVTTFYDPRCVSLLTEEVYFMLQRSLEPFFPRLDQPGLILNTTQGMMLGAYDISLTRTAENLHLFPLYADGAATLQTVSSYADRVASILTSALRKIANHALPGNRPAVGIVKVTKTCANVTWPWLIFPAILALATVGFMTGMILHTRHYSRNPLWPGLFKSSPLALMLYGPSNDALFKRYNGPKDLVPLEDLADSIKTRLERRGSSEKTTSLHDPLA
ncbi:Hypothetical protein D9617_24g016630 [Elsinoe fawcettii]|nr:Hypothetical protein D9617_24g016630 [Elsinoe fawcettii]